LEREGGFEVLDGGGQVTPLELNQAVQPVHLIGLNTDLLGIDNGYSSLLQIAAERRLGRPLQGVLTALGEYRVFLLLLAPRNFVIVPLLVREACQFRVTRALGLPDYRSCSYEHSRSHHPGHGQRRPVPPRRLAEPVPRRRRPRLDRLVLQE